MKELSQTKIGYLLDTSILIFLIKEDSLVHERMPDNAKLYMSIIALGELYHGAEHSIDVEKGLSDANKLAQTLTVLVADNDTAKIYGRIKHEQRMKGQMLPDNDLWIAATAIQGELILAARDRHFSWLTGITLEQW